MLQQDSIGILLLIVGLGLAVLLLTGKLTLGFAL